MEIKWSHSFCVYHNLIKLYDSGACMMFQRPSLNIFLFISLLIFSIDKHFKVSSPSVFWHPPAILQKQSLLLIRAHFLKNCVKVCVSDDDMTWCAAEGNKAAPPKTNPKGAGQLRTIYLAAAHELTYRRWRCRWPGNLLDLCNYRSCWEWILQRQPTIDGW